MAKTQKSYPNNRPMIIVSVSNQKWGVEYKKGTEELILVNRDKRLPAEHPNFKISDYQIIEPKEKTLTSGDFSVQFRDGWSLQCVLKDGTFKSYWDCNITHTDTSMNSAEECFKAIQVAKKAKPMCAFTICRRQQTYFNPKTKEITTDKSIAKRWFKGKNPLFVSSSQYQRIGMWIEPAGKDCVDVTIWYNNRIQRNNCEQWKNGTKTGFRLYNDGTISHFYKGKLREERIFETNRITYRSLDVRFPEQYRLSTLMADLRSPEIIGADGDCTDLCDETKRILKEAGFPDTYWCWRDTCRPFKDTYDLVNFVTFPQHIKQTKTGLTLDEFLADKPFEGKNNEVLPFNKGVIIRIPGYRPVWECEGRIFDHKPHIYEHVDETKARLLEVVIYEKYRLWISNDLKKKTCQENVHNGTCWKSIRWDNVDFEEGDYYIEENCKPEELALQSKAKKELHNKFNALYVNILINAPFLVRFKDFIDRHPAMRTGHKLKSFLGSLLVAPKITETLIKIGYENWFFTDTAEGNMFCYESGFDFRRIINRFALGSSFKENAKYSFYKNLGVTKEQFLWLASIDDCSTIMQNFRDANIPIPGKHNEYYHGFETIPLKYLKIFDEGCKYLSEAHVGEPCWSDYSSAAMKIKRLVNDYEFSPLDIEKCIKRHLDMEILIDYLRMRAQCIGSEGFNISHWDKIPADRTDLRFTHDRMLECYNLMQAERERYYRAEEEKRLIKCQEDYDIRYKKLKKLAYQEDGDNRIVVVPQKLIELVTEGQVLHHCVGSFTTSVSEGRDTIVFLRDKETPSTPYATVSLLQKGDKWVIDQAHTAYNGPITDTDVAFLKRWAQKNNVDPETVHNNYGLHCHH